MSGTEDLVAVKLDAAGGGPTSGDPPAPDAKDAKDTKEANDGKDGKDAKDVKGDGAVALTRGSVKRLFDSKSSDGVTTPWPVLQVLEVRQLPGDASKGAPRYRLLLSDGDEYLQSMMASDLNERVGKGFLKPLSIVKLHKWVVNTVGNRKILVSVKMDVVGPGPHHTRVGNPQDIERAGANAKKPSAGAVAAVGGGASAAAAKRKAPGGDGKDGKDAKSGSGPRVMAIADLNAHLQGKWAIKARVAKKNAIREWSNQKSVGKLFTMDLLDAEGGQIRASAFNAQCEKFYDIILEGKVFMIKNGSIKNVDRSKAWNRTAHHNCEISLTSETQITQVPDDPSIQGARYDFVKIRDIHNCSKDDMVDVLGIVTQVSPLTELTSKKTGQPMSKRTLTVQDDTNMSIEVTLWNQLATLNDEERLANQPVVVLKSLQVTDYGGKSLSMGFEGDVLLSLDRPEFAALKNWWETVADKSIVADCLTVRANANNARVVIQDIEDQQLGFGDQPDYVLIRANITQFNYSQEKPPWYKACQSIISGKEGKPDRPCAQKVVATEGQEEGQYTCVKCGNVPDYTNRFMLSCQASDGTGVVWMTAFDEVATKLVGGKSADKLASMLEQDEADQVNRIFQQESLFHYWILKCRIKAETGGKHNDTLRQRIHIIAAEPMDFKKEHSYLQSILSPAS